MNENHIQMALAFQRVTFLPGSFDKRFCHSMLSYAKKQPEKELTVKQISLLEEKYHRYRRQIPDHEQICTICGPNAKSWRCPWCDHLNWPTREICIRCDTPRPPLTEAGNGV